MKRVLFFLTVSLMLLLVFGCSDSSRITNTGDDAAITLVQRPEFVETRPPEVVTSYVVKPSPGYLQDYEKKPTPPDPDPDDPNPNPAHKYAYIVGISDYEGTANDLQYADDDAVGMKAYFQSQGFTIKMDLDGNATGDNITAGLQWLIDQAEPGDEIVFSYSGHGAKAPGYGSSIISADLYYVTHGYVMQYFNAVDCSKKLATLDCCVAADFHLDVVTGTYMATASSNTYSYDAPTLEHGAWTYYWLEAAEDLDLVFAEDVTEYAEAMMAVWAKTYHLKVSPTHTDMYAGKLDM